MSYRIKPSYLKMGEEEINKIPRFPGCSRPARRCYSAVSTAHPRGSFYPNYQTFNNALTGLSRPTPASGCRDDSLDNLVTDELKVKLNTILPATGTVYVGGGGPGELDGSGPWDHSDAATWWLLEHNGHLVGVTVLHIFQFAMPFKIYINTTMAGNLKSERVSFQRQDVNLVDFVEVKLRTDLIELREKYIRDLHTSRDATKASANIDPDYHLQYAVTCDIAFLDLEVLPDVEKAKFLGRPRLKIASNPPEVGAFDVTIGYHYGGPWKQMELEYEFAATAINTPPPGILYFSDIRSVSLGKVKGVGSGLVTDISTMEEMSSGSPKMIVEGGEFRVFGISVGSYYDKPDPPASTLDWTLLYDDNPAKIDVQLPEPGRSTNATAKNRNIILGFHHPCVAEMLHNI